MLDRVSFGLWLGLRLASFLLIGQRVTVSLLIAALGRHRFESRYELWQDVADIGSWVRCVTNVGGE